MSLAAHLRLAGVIVSAALFAAGVALAAPFTLTHTINNPPPVGQDWFGYAVDVSDGIAVISARLDDQGGAVDSGGAYLVDTTTGAILHTLLNPNSDGNDDDQFGNAVGIDGARAVVGSWLADGTSENQGEVYVYDTATGALQTTLSNPFPTSTGSADVFGFSVDISGDMIVVGARGEDQSAADGGLAYVFDAVSGALLNTLANPLASAGDAFGFEVAIDQNLIAVSARTEDIGGTDTGAVFLYDALTGDLLQTLTSPTPENFDSFGWGLDVDDGRVLVSAPLSNTGATDAGEAYLFDAATGTLLHTFLNPEPTFNDQFGRSLSLDGDLVVVGALFDDSGGVGNEGSIYAYDAITGALIQSIANPFPSVFDNFGGQFSDGLALDGDTLVVGAFLDDTGIVNAGQAYVYDFEPILGVPAPAASALLLLGLAGLLVRRSARQGPHTGEDGSPGIL